MLQISQSGTDLDKLSKKLKKMKSMSIDNILEQYAEQGRVALSDATPKDTGLTSSSWRYKIKRERNQITIAWINDNVNKGVPVAVVIQYGHATGTGGWVEGIDYINPAMKKIFQTIADDIWKEVNK